MPRLEKSGYRKYWELRQLVGHNADGTRRTAEGYRNMQTGEFHTSEGGWNDRPPELPPGDRDPVLSNRYKDNYERTFGHS